MKRPSKKVMEGRSWGRDVLVMSLASFFFAFGLIDMCNGNIWGLIPFGCASPVIIYYFAIALLDLRGY